MAEGNNTIGNNRFNSVDVKPPLNLPKGSPLEKSLAKEKEDFFKKSQTEREKVGKDSIGSLAGSKTTIITEDVGSSVRFRQVKNGILKETDKVTSGDEVTLMGRYLMHQIDGTNHGLLKVQLADGREGYIAATHLQAIGGTPEPTPKPKVPEPTPKPKEVPKPSPDYPIAKNGLPIAKLTGKPGHVTSPYPPHIKLDVKDMLPGSIAKDPTTEGLFVVPAAEPTPKPKVPEPTPKPKVPEPTPKPKVPEPTPKPKVPEVQQTTDWSKEAKWILDTWGFGGGHATHIGPKFRASANKTLGDLTPRDIAGFSTDLESNFPNIKKDASGLEKQWLDRKTAELGGGNLSPVQKNKVKDMSIYEIQKEITP